VLLLDTHTWIWSVEGDAHRIGRRARQLLARAASADAIRISPATIFELTALHTAGRLRLARSPAQWVGEALTARGVRLAPLSATIAVEAGSLSRTAINDPLDRLLVATARQLDATFLTSDTRILEYAAASDNVRVHDASQ
jgi:PIN domain nuclease of toxin-antitoxin system